MAWVKYSRKPHGRNFNQKSPQRMYFLDHLNPLDLLSVKTNNKKRREIVKPLAILKLVISSFTCSQMCYNKHSGHETWKLKRVYNGTNCLNCIACIFVNEYDKAPELDNNVQRHIEGS